MLVVIAFGVYPSVRRRRRRFRVFCLLVRSNFNNEVHSGLYHIQSRVALVRAHTHTHTNDSLIGVSAIRVVSSRKSHYSLART